MRHVRVRLMVVAAVVLALLPALASDETAAADTDKVISALVLDQVEATALGVKLQSVDDSSSASSYVTARYLDESPGWYDIVFQVTLGSCKSLDEVSLQGKASGCGNCLDPNCATTAAGGQQVPKRPCYRAYRNGWTDFGNLSGETLFAHGDLLVRVTSESSPASAVGELKDYQSSLARHQWFVEQVAQKLAARYLADAMQLSVSASVEMQPAGSGGQYAGREVVVLEGTVSGPSGGVAGAVVEGMAYSPTMQGWSYATTADAAGRFRHIVGPRDGVSRVSVKVRHTNATPAYAGTVPVTIDQFGGQPPQPAAGMTVAVATDRPAYPAGDSVTISGRVADSAGGLAGATVIVEVSGASTSLTTDAAGGFQVGYTIPTDAVDGVYTVAVKASHAGHPDAGGSVTFIVGEMGFLIERNSATGKPFVGVAADGISTLQVLISLPGAARASVQQPPVGELKGDSLGAGGALKLDASGQALLTYRPPQYPSVEQLGLNVGVHSSGSPVWAAEVPLAVSYEDSSGRTARLEAKVLVCRPPVMLVHGFIGAPTTWAKMSTYLRGEKFDTFMGDYSSSTLSIEGLSGLLQSHIAQQKLEYAAAGIRLTKVDLVGHSMGGLISRYYVNGLPGYSGDVRKLIMVGTPNHGVTWSSKKIGNVASQWYGNHRTPAEQLYSDSLFMRSLNAGETTGAHLNHDVQYGSIYGLPDDWVVSAASAYLNGVNAVLQSDVKHSADIPGVPAVAITEYLATWGQVKSWLTSDIFRPPLKDSQAEVYKHWGEVYVVDYDATGRHEARLTSSPAALGFFQGLRTGKDSKAILHLTVGGRPWGVIYVDAGSELLLGYCSPQLLEVRLWSGSASFRSKQGGHFSVPVNIDRSAAGEWWRTSPQAVVTGLDTLFAVDAGNGIAVHCLEGRLQVDTPEGTKESAVVSGGQSVTVTGETVAAAAAASEGDFWWSAEEDDFLEESPVAEALDDLQSMAGAALNWLRNAAGSLVSWAKSLF